MADDEEISYMALRPGTPVMGSAGTRFGTVEHVLQVPELDLFDGLVVKVGKDIRFVDRDRITSMTASAVTCDVSDAEVESLPLPQGTLVVRPDPGHDEGRSLSAWYGRTFGREHWKDVD
jgi:hypothetical protein